jgi:hypothetical protein
MSSIIRDGDTFHGISVFGRGVFTDKCGWTYAGQCKDGHACGLGVVTWPGAGGAKEYAEHGPDGKYDGRYLGRISHGRPYSRLYERGKRKEYAEVSATGRYCNYNDEDCAPDDPRLLALIAQVAPVEVRPAARAPHPPSARHSDPTQSSDGSAGSFLPPAGAGGCRGHRGAFPRRTPSLVVVRHNPTAAALQCGIVSPRSLLGRALHFKMNPVWVWAGRGSRGQPAAALGGARAHCGHQVRRGTLGVLKRPLRAAHGVLMAYSRGIPPPGFTRDSTQRGMR